MSRQSAAAEFPTQVDGSTLAMILGVTRPRITQLVDEGLPQSSAKTFHLPSCIQWIIKRERENKKGNEYQDKKISLVDAQRDKIVIETKILEGKLIDINEAQNAINALASSVASALDGVAGRISAECFGKKTQAEVQDVILREHRAIRSEIASELSNIARTSGVDYQTTTEPERGRVGRRKQATS